MSNVENHIQEEAPKKSGAGRKIATGCGIGCLVILIAAAVLGFYVKRNWRRIAADKAQKHIMQVVNASDLPDDQKKAVEGHVARLSEAFKSQKISVEQLGKAGQMFAEGPIMPLIVVRAFEAKYVAPSGLPAQEKQRASLDLNRFMRGIVEKKIPQSAVDEVIEPISVQDDKGQRRVKETLTQDELKAFLASVRQRADKAKVPDERYVVDVAAEVGKIVDGALKAQDQPPER